MFLTNAEKKSFEDMMFVLENSRTDITSEELLQAVIDIATLDDLTAEKKLIVLGFTLDFFRKGCLERKTAIRELRASVKL